MAEDKPLPFAAHTQALMDSIRRAGFPPISQHHGGGQADEGEQQEPAPLARSPGGLRTRWGGMPACLIVHVSISASMRFPDGARCDARAARGRLGHGSVRYKNHIPIIGIGC